MRELPDGRLTLLFTDVEGSTRLLHELGSGYADVLADHRRALREAFARHGGTEVDTQGDAFFFVFRSADDALAAATEGCELLEEGRVRVRIGIHAGAPILTSGTSERTSTWRRESARWDTAARSCFPRQPAASCATATSCSISASID
jgi:class 3 adenylate cyclase